MSVDNYQSQKTDISESEIVAIPLFTSKSEPEPVAWMHDVVIDGKVRYQELKFNKVTNDKYAQNHRPLFTSPPVLKRLSDDELEERLGDVYFSRGKPTAIVAYELSLYPKPGAAGNKGQETGCKLFFGEQQEAYEKACDFAKNLRSDRRIFKIENLIIISDFQQDHIESDGASHRGKINE